MAKKAGGKPAKPSDRAPSQPKPADKAAKTRKKQTLPASAVPDPATPVQPSDDGPFLVVGVGASAGGLESITELLRHLPSAAGIALVFIQHLDPHHKSSLAEILGRATEMPVVEIADAQPVKPNCVYVTPPDRDVAIMHGTLHLMQRPPMPGRHLPVDYFFRSLAQDQGNRAVAVILSGTGADGSAGLREIKAEGGLVFAETPQSAKYAGMPQSAMATGQVDLALPAREIAQHLVRIARHPHLRSPSRRSQPPGLFDSPEGLQKIFLLLRKTSGVDFANYKQSTVERRLARRMLLHRIDTISQYAKFLEQSPEEIGALFEDMLINVTSFFRDPKVFDTLKSKIFPRVFEQKSPEAPVRIWVPACSTGEESYSIAITLAEYMQSEKIASPVQIFATDISDAAIERARQGKYSEDIAEHVSPERLRQFFVRNGGGYQISKTVRDLCVFARQNVTKDPPFSGLDLLSCRNLLIYMGPSFQRRIIPTFHYALKSTGYLMLGQSETIGGFAELFTLVDRAHKIYAKKPGAARIHLEMDGAEYPPLPGAERKPSAPAPLGEFNLDREADRAVLGRYGPPGVVINGEMEILQFRGQTGRFLEPSPGAASWNLLKMAREGLSLDLRAVVHKARKKNASARVEGLHVRYNGSILTVSIEVIPLVPGRTEEAYLLVLFEEVAALPVGDAKALADGDRKAGEKGSDQEIQMLRTELALTKETLQHIIEEHEATNEELRAANEEIQSANEELQSTNEELETAKEELQSTNEELTTLNTELESQNLELNRAIDDFNNLHNSVNIPVVLLGTDLRIRSFTPPAERSLRLIPADSGRPIGELKLGIEVKDLERKVLEVLDSLNTFEEEVQAHDRRWYLMRIRPYRTTDNKITGAVLALIDIQERKLAEEELHDAQLFSGSIVATIREPLLVLDGQLRVQMANPSFYREFHVAPGQTEGRLLFELGNGQWDIPKLRQLLSDVIPQDHVVEGFRVEHDFPQIGRVSMVLNARRIDQGPSRPERILLAIERAKD